MRHLIWVWALVWLAGCAGSAPSAEQEVKEEAISDILSKPLAGEEYVEEERCLSTSTYRSVEVLDDRHVLFKGLGKKAWLNTLRNRCIGLRPRETLQFRLRDNRACDMDTFEAVSSSFLFFDRISATCALGTFTPVTPEQVDAIKAALTEERSAKR